MNNTSNLDSKAKLIVILASLVVILAIALAFTFILKPHQTKDTETTEINTKQSELKDTEINQEADTKGINSEIIDKSSLSEEVDQNSENAESAGDMNGDTTTGVEITGEMKEYNEKPESTVTEEDNTAEEPKQEGVYVPDNTPQVDNTPEPAHTPEDNSNSNSGSSLDWGSDEGFNTSGIDVDTGGYGWGDTTGWTWQGDVFSDTPEGDENGWGDTTGWTWQGADTNQDINWESPTHGWLATSRNKRYRVALLKYLTFLRLRIIILNYTLSLHFSFFVL